MVSFKSLVGERFGMLLVETQAPSQASGAAWNCRCDCGNVLVVTASNLRKGQRQCKACGQSAARTDLVGRVFGRLTVLRFEKTRRSKPYWLCRCTCGETKVIAAQSLMQRDNLSCGCLGREHRLAANTKHGMQDHQVYIAWENMKQRCLNPRHIAYPRYGGRGITICDRWLEFAAFRDDVFPTWAKGLTLDRVDPNGNYEPSNFAWASRQHQARNQERTIKVEYDGALRPIAEVAGIVGIKRVTLLQRMQRGLVAPELFMAKLPQKPRQGHRGGATHRMSAHPSYRSWKSARSRCQDANAAGYSQYGGRGITFDDYWMEYENFWSDMGPTWFKGATLDRIDNDKGYGAENCRWATPLEQANNRRATTFIETPLGTMTIGNAARAFGIKRNTLMARLRYGWTDPAELVKPPMEKTEFLRQYQK